MKTGRLKGEKHPIHLVAKKAGQLNKVMQAIIKEERPNQDAPRLISHFRRELAKAASQLNRLAVKELAVYRNTGSVSRSSLYMMKESFRTLRDEFEGLKGPQFMRGGKPPKMIRRQERHACEPIFGVVQYASQRASGVEVKTSSRAFSYDLVLFPDSCS